MKLSNHKLIKIHRLVSLTVLLIVVAAANSRASQLLVNDSLILAKVRSGDIPALSGLLDSDVDINREFGPQQRTLLTYAIQYRQSETALYLISLGTDVEQLDEDKTPLMFAALLGDKLITKAIIQEEAQLDFFDREGNTAFIYASRNNNLEILKLLYAGGADINTTNQDNWTALDYSITP